MKRKLWIITTFVGILVLGISLILQCVILSPIMYKNNNVFSSAESKQIKNLVLNAVKDRCSNVFEIDKESIYSSDSNADIIEQIEPLKQKSMFCFIDRNFMDTLVKSGTTYTVIVKCYFPESYIYHITMEQQNGAYVITEFLLDI